MIDTENLTAITTENAERHGHHRGRIAILRSWKAEDSHLTYADLVIQNVEGVQIRLNRIEVGKIADLAGFAFDQVEIVSDQECSDRMDGQS